MKKRIGVLLILAVLWMQPVFAETATTQQVYQYDKYFYVAGNPNNYPIEFYDEATKSYKGVIPDMLNRISELSDIGFIYVNGNKDYKQLSDEEFQVEIVSSVSKGVYNEKEYIELVSYIKNGETFGVGIAFTDFMKDSQQIELIKKTVSEISASEINGIYLSYASFKNEVSVIWGTLAAGFLIILIVAVAILVVHIRKMHKENENDKMTDDETGMGNLRFFKYHFTNTISDSQRDMYHIAYIALDSSYLLSYYGDSSFEDVVEYTSIVIAESVSDDEFYARIAENGFAIAYLSTNEHDAKARLVKIIEKLNSFEGARKKNKTVVFHASTYHLSPADKNCEILFYNLRKSCIAIAGTEKQVVYCDASTMNVVQQEKDTKERILKGFENNEFKMFLQFVVDNKTKKIAFAEALSRWDNSEKGLLGPDKYIESMEKAGLISKLDFYMFDLVCRQLEKWSKTEYKDISISCNITRITLSQSNFVEEVLRICDRYDFDKTKVSIEITEEAIENDKDIAMQNITKCKELGFKIYLDDLGSGYTTLSNLCDYPIDVVKIDRGILQKADTPKGKHLFFGIIALAHSINVDVVCEGVETKEQSIMVTQTECDYIQGWYYSTPIALEECEEFIASKEASLTE